MELTTMSETPYMAQRRKLQELREKQAVGKEVPAPKKKKAKKKASK